MITRCIYNDKGNLMHLDTNMNNNAFAFKSKGRQQKRISAASQPWELEVVMKLR